jgi:NtrC-family two-component system sensor histidine kinase KinB
MERRNEMFGLRQKLMVGFGGLLATLLLVSGLGVTVVVRYRTELDRFFYENWRSVEYGQHIAEAMVDLDEIARSLQQNPSAAALAAAAKSAAKPLTTVDENCAAEDRNITLGGEKQIASDLTLSWSGRTLDGQPVTADAYREQFTRLLDPSLAGPPRLAEYEKVRKLSGAVRRHADEVIHLNLGNMRPIDGRAKEMADRAVLLMVGGALAGTGLAVVFTFLVTRSILRPLSTVIHSIREIEQGNLDLVVQVRSNDEFKQLGDAFNSMAAKLREYRRTNRAKLLRTQQTTQLAVNSLPDAVAVMAPDGTIELSNDAAQQLFGLTAGSMLVAVADRRLVEVYQEVVQTGRPSKPRGYESAVEVYGAGGQLRFFLPHGVPICEGSGREARPIGVTIVLADVSNLRRLDEMKSGLLSVVSHELKTPLTSIRMAIHLLLEERVGPLTPKQGELVTAAREDSDRLDRIIAGLLDMGRLESGHVELDLRPVSPEQLIADGVDPLRAAFHDKGVSLSIEVPPDVPAVSVDSVRMGHVFSNLLTNALKFTGPGGEVRVSAEVDQNDQVRFTVADTGTGIGAEYLPRVFDRFFRVPGQAASSGAGLGLAIARDIVHAHGGTIEVASDVGKGARFSFTLSRAVDERLPAFPRLAGVQPATPAEIAS